MTDPCQKTSEVLADYLDGELPADEARQVADHLASCPRCRDLAGAMDRSLAAARIVWQEVLHETARTASLPKTAPRPWIRCAAVAAAALIVGVGALCWLVRVRRAEPALTLARVQQEILDCGRAAQLLAATDILARCEGTAEIVDRQRNYILAQYPSTPAALTLRNDPTRKGALQNE